MYYLFNRLINRIRCPYYDPIVITVRQKKKWMKEKGINLGTKMQTAINANNMIEENIPIDVIAKITGLSIKKIEKLRNHD